MFVLYSGLKYPSPDLLLQLLHPESEHELFGELPELSIATVSAQHCKHIYPLFNLLKFKAWNNRKRVPKFPLYGHWVMFRAWHIMNLQFIKRREANKLWVILLALDLMESWFLYRNRPCLLECALWTFLKQQLTIRNFGRCGNSIVLNLLLIYVYNSRYVKRKMLTKAPERSLVLRIPERISSFSTFVV